MKMDYIVVIPARYASTRLPGKPLISIADEPMILRVYKQCAKAVDPKKIFVATDDQRILNVCNVNNINVVMTSSECLTGTDRVAEVAKLIKSDLYINVQGDEPLFNPSDLTLLVNAAQQNPDIVINGYCEIKDVELYMSRSIPKVVCDEQGMLRYMSRAPIPASKSGEFKGARRQVCAYSFPRELLTDFAQAVGKTPLEEIEDIEILRFLEMGYEVKMIEMSDASVAVDNPEDVVKVERILAKNTGRA